MAAQQPDRVSSDLASDTAWDPPMPGRCGADLMRCPSCDVSVGRANIRDGVGCPRCPGVEPWPGHCRRPVRPGARCRFHGKDAPQTRRAAQRRQREARALAALERLDARETARRAALAPFGAEIAEATRLAELGGPNATLRLRQLARAVRRASDELYAEARRREAGPSKPGRTA